MRNLELRALILSQELYLQNQVPVWDNYVVPEKFNPQINPEGGMQNSQQQDPKESGGFLDTKARQEIADQVFQIFRRKFEVVHETISIEDFTTYAWPKLIEATGMDPRASNSAGRWEVAKEQRRTLGEMRDSVYTKYFEPLVKKAVKEYQKNPTPIQQPIRHLQTEPAANEPVRPLSPEELEKRKRYADASVAKIKAMLQQPPSSNPEKK